MARKPGKGMVQFQIDMTDMNNMIGLVFATEKLGTGSRYLKSLIMTSFHTADEEFNREITATALASGRYRHMYEWGTTGINEAGDTTRNKPDSEAARLWKTYMTQGTKYNNINFVYKPSSAVVPKPDFARNKIPAAITNKLSDHVFWNKAKVMETGMTVRVARKNAKALFIPLAYSGRTGFMLRTGPTHPTPGSSEFFKSHKGTFTTAFKTFWEGRGSAFMQEETSRLFAIDLEMEKQRLDRQRGKWSIPNTMNDKQQIERTKRTVVRNLELAAAKREETYGQ